MSGVAGADRVKSRADFEHFIQDYKNLISLFPGFVSLQPSGSYNSNPDKQDFGDIDLIVHIKSDLDKAQVKKQLQAFFMKEPETKIVPFSSEKHAGKRTYNAGELVSVRYHDDALGYSAQIDNIIALDKSEASFKQSFLDMPAEKQGLILGLVKIAAIETDPQILFKKLGITAPTLTKANEEYEFNLSSVELQLRKVTYKPETYEQIGREVIWTSRNFDDLNTLLYQYDLNSSFDDLLSQSKRVIKNPRSNNRMQGVFNSMITVKSGEVGTAKGAGKIAASQKVAQTFGENKTYGRLFDALVRNTSEDTLVFTFGRFQIPTNGHAALINEVKGIAAKYHAPYAIFVSRTVGDTTAKKYKNPLTIDQKMPYITQAFPGVNFIPCTAQMSTIIDIAQYINQKYKKIVMVAGKDRMEGAMNFKSLLEERNGIDFQFDDMQFETVARDPDSESSSSMKEFVKQDNWQAFRNDLPRTLDDETAEKLWSDLKVALAPVPRKKPVRQNAKAKEKQGVAEGLGQNQGQVRQTLNAWMNQDQQYKDPTQRKGFQAKVWPYIQKNIKTILADKGEDGKGSYPASPFAAWLLVQHMDAYPQNQGEFLQQLAQSGLDPTDGKGGEGKLQFLKDRYEVNKWIAANANNKEYFINDKPLPNPTVNVRNPAMFKDAGQVATSRKDALDNAIAAGNKLLVAAVQATDAKTQPSYKQGVAESNVDEGLGQWARNAAMVGALGLGAIGSAHAGGVSIGPDGQPDAKGFTAQQQQTMNQKMSQQQKPFGVNMNPEYLKQAASGARGRFMISQDDAKAALAWLNQHPEYEIPLPVKQQEPDNGQTLNQYYKDHPGIREEKRRLDPACMKGRINNCVPIGEELEQVMAHYIRILESKHG